MPTIHAPRRAGTVGATDRDGWGSIGDCYDWPTLGIRGFLVGDSTGGVRHPVGRLCPGGARVRDERGDTCPLPRCEWQTERGDYRRYVVAADGAGPVYVFGAGLTIVEFATESEARAHIEA